MKRRKEYLELGVHFELGRMFLAVLVFAFLIFTWGWSPLRGVSGVATGVFADTSNSIA